ncbi:MAG TPA: HD domain-containing phosphohydrolase [Tepidisphaeraceae bacterium]|jgi:putative two-component system response regulator|nr:HD domain-containing phosphohydrolase [Tepidisphaeraceae bacterium]
MNTATETQSASVPPDDRLLRAKIMIVDDEPLNVKVVRKYLQSAGYSNFVTTCDSTTCMQLLQTERPDLVLLDVMMPNINGLQILESIRAHERFQHLPVVILTASTDAPTKLAALERGATDFLPKPIDPHELLPRVRNVLIVKAHQDYLANYSAELEREVQNRTAELQLSRLRVFECLARAGEFRDDATGRHVVRVGRCAAVIAEALGFDRRQCATLEVAAQLHDIGKIGVPDAILLKPGKLEPEEFALMKRHCQYGKAIIDSTARDESGLSWQLPGRPDDSGENSESPLLAMAATIALTHHEKFDGTGYPRGLKGEAIPLEGRITAISDVFDALHSARPYKPAFDMPKCAEIIRQSRGTHFDPAISDAFAKLLPDLAEIHRLHSDPQIDAHPGQ